jgi:saxitoxin biosynthesis operon SxtJ-like protein
MEGGCRKLVDELADRMGGSVGAVTWAGSADIADPAKGARVLAMTKVQIATHENLERSTPVVGSSDRSFGIIFTAFFLFVGLLPLVRGGRIRTWPLAVAAVFLALSLLRPRLLAPLNRAWIQIGLLLHRVVSPVVMGLIFFATITPMGLVMRWFGHDPLRLGFDADARSYWIERRPPGPAPETMSNQF